LPLIYIRSFCTLHILPPIPPRGLGLLQVAAFDQLFNSLCGSLRKNSAEAGACEGLCGKRRLRAQGSELGAKPLTTETRRTWRCTEKDAFIV